MNAPLRQPRIERPVRQWSELFRWPVHRDFFCMKKPVAWFDTWDEASTFAMANDLYLGEPTRRRK